MSLKKETTFTLGFKIVKRDTFNHVANKPIKLQHTTDGHYKYYVMTILSVGNSSLTNFTVKCEYGKIGNAASVKKHGFQTEEQAVNFVRTKLKQQLKKGYVIK